MRLLLVLLSSLAIVVIFTSDNGGLFHYWEAKEADDVKHYGPR